MLQCIFHFCSSGTSILSGRKSLIPQGVMEKSAIHEDEEDVVAHGNKTAVDIKDADVDKDNKDLKNNSKDDNDKDRGHENDDMNKESKVVEGKAKVTGSENNDLKKEKGAGYQELDLSPVAVSDK